MYRHKARHRLGLQQLLLGQLLLPAALGWQHALRRAQVSPQTVMSTLQQELNLDLTPNGRVAWTVEWADLVEDPAAARKAAQAVKAGQVTSTALREMMGCINDAYTGLGMDWDKATHDQLGDLKAVAGFYSTADARAEVTLTTFGSLNRLQQLHAQCMHWRGPLSAVLYEPLLQSPEHKGLTALSRTALKAAVIRLAQLVSELQRHPGACRLDLLLTYEIVHDEPTRDLIPLNLLRNLARLQARTPLMAALDIDLLPSRSFYNRVVATNKDLQKQVAKGKDFVFIIPTFDLNKEYHYAAWAEALSLLNSKDVMVTALKSKIAAPFLQEWKTGHGLTKFDQWMNATEDYDTQYEYRCEPWLLTSRTHLPWHDARFRGWGEDKLQQLLAVHHAGHHFRVLYDSFTVHRAHKVAGAKAFYKDKVAPAGSIPWNSYANGLFVKEAKALNASQPYQPMNPPSVTNCMNKLSWW